MIQIDMEMTKSCGGCPCVIYTAEEKKAIGYCNTSNEDYYCKALDRFMEYDKVDGGLDILGKPSDCPLKEVPSGEWIRQMKSEIADSLEFWDYSPNNNPLARDMLETINTYCAKMIEEQQGENT